MPLAGLVRTAKEREGSWCARRRGCSPRGTVRMCSFWISSMPPIAIAPSFASARLSGNAALLKLAMKFTCARPPRVHAYILQTLNVSPPALGGSPTLQCAQAQVGCRLLSGQDLEERCLVLRASGKHCMQDIGPIKPCCKRFIDGSSR